MPRGKTICNQCGKEVRPWKRVGGLCDDCRGIKKQEPTEEENMNLFGMRKPSKEPSIPMPPPPVPPRRAEPVYQPPEEVEEVEEPPVKEVRARGRPMRKADEEAMMEEAIQEIEENSKTFENTYGRMFYGLETDPVKKIELQLLFALWSELKKR